jgi:uncharacterized protein (DUF1684 family)
LPIAQLLFAPLFALIAVAAPGGAAVADDRAYLNEIRTHRDNVDFFFRDRILSPLIEADRLVFGGLNYFPVMPSMAIAARLEVVRNTSTFAMPTYDNRTLNYSHFGTVRAQVHGQQIRLKVFRREDAEVQRNFLLIPFRDLTNDQETYAGGRYLEIDPPASDRLVLDFNRAMNPWCAYDASYACPIPPPENRLLIPIRAGEKRFR